MHLHVYLVVMVYYWIVEMFFCGRKSKKTKQMVDTLREMKTSQTSGLCFTHIFVSVGPKPTGLHAEPNLYDRQHTGIDKTWSLLSLPACSCTTTHCYKLPNTSQSCAVPSARQEICLGDLASNGQCHWDLGHMPASSTSGRCLNSLGRIRRHSMIWFNFMVWLVSEKFLLAFKFVPS